MPNITFTIIYLNHFFFVNVETHYINTHPANLNASGDPRTLGQNANINLFDKIWLIFIVVNLSIWNSDLTQMIIIFKPVNKHLYTKT